MAVSNRGQKVYDIDQDNFSSIHLKGYIRTYFKDGSLNIASGVPVLVLENNPTWIDICVSNEHPFYNLFKELSKTNEELYNYYFKEKHGSKIKEKITLRINCEEMYESKQFCKLDIKVRIMFEEGVFFRDENDPQYFEEWKFLLDLNRIDFV